MDQGLDAAAALGRVEVDIAVIDMGSIPAASGDPDHDLEEEHQQHQHQHPEHLGTELAGASTIGIETTLVVALREHNSDASGAEEAGSLAACQDESGARLSGSSREFRRGAPEWMTAILGRVHEVLAAAGHDADDLDLDPALAACVQHSLRGPHLAATAPDTEPPPHTVSAYGMHLHAATTVDGRDRRRLERVCRYLLRPPFAHDAIEALADGRIRVHSTPRREARPRR